ncbi:SANT/Myb domain [Sesbania bispinosa]|nr:SANT/Myb domain [Sesbania bispinosa]
MKRLDYGFRGFQVPTIPRRPRSARRRVPFNKPTVGGHASAFDLLASLAGKLLQESESSASSNASEGSHQPAFSQCVVEQERKDEVKPLTEEGICNGTCAECILMTDVGSHNGSKKCLECTETECALECISANNNSDSWEKVKADVKSEIFKWENKFEHHSNRLVKVPEDEEIGRSGFKGLSLDNKFSLKDPLELGLNSPALIDMKSDVKSPFCRELFPNASFSGQGNDTKLGFIDDDENFLRCNEVGTKSKAFRPSKCIAHRIIRNRFTSKSWKVAPKLKDCEHSRFDKGVKPLNRKRKTCYNFERHQYYSLFKRRRFYDKGSAVTSDGGFSSESVSDSPEKGIGGNNPSPSVSKGPRVKFSIKSFRIPELYVEVPETTTVGSLKRTVMEAVMAILGDGVRVGVLVQGKKVRDDKRTLLQTGISCKENLDKLGFVLEPTSCQASPAVCVGDPSQCNISQPTRSPGTPALDSGISDAVQDSSLLTNTGILVEINHDSTSSHTDIIADKLTPDSRALVVVPARSTEALPVVPVNQKTKRSELVQRRTRRPFSASEVEALVLAVEELGTGRWRDVKLRAFENADHRTYVDLKDKWKTLVHTAKISPQQRRGEPVPQELLNRVLAAHAYWSHHQAKQHVKHQAGPIKIKEASAERHSVDGNQALVMIEEEVNGEMGGSGAPDFFYKEARRLGYVARSAFKLLQIQKQHKVIKPASSVLDLGCAPGAWLQVACQSLGPFHNGGFILGIDLKKVKVPPLHCDSRVQTISADVMTLPTHQLRALSPKQKGFSVILSDMCPLVSGITTKDAALSLELGMRALELAVGRVASSVYADDGNDDNREEQSDNPSGSDDKGVLQVGGNLIIKLLESEDTKEISQISKPLFRKSSWLRPKATRPSSREIYLICQGLKPDAKT